MHIYADVLKARVHVGDLDGQVNKVYRCIGGLASVATIICIN